MVKFRWNGNGVELIGNTRLTTPLKCRRRGPTVAPCSSHPGADDRVIYSASDLAAAARCEYALLRVVRRQARLGSRGRRRRRTARPHRPTRWRARTAPPRRASRARRGERRDHRSARLHRRRADRGRGGDHARGRAPRAGHLSGRDVRRPVRRLRRLPGLRTGRRSYRLRDTKLARSVKVEALLQLAAYADTLARAGVPVAPEVELVLGDGADGRATASTNCFRSTGPAAPRCSACSTTTWPAARRSRGRTTSVRACFRCPECTIQVRAHDDLLLVAGMRVSQRARLIDAGITTVQRRSPATTARVPELSARTVDSADRAGTPADRAARRRQAALRGRRRAAADGAARARQGRSVLRLRGRPAVDGRRPRVGAGVPVRGARHRRRLPPAVGARPRRANVRRCATS